MATYEYRCAECGRNAEQEWAIGSAPREGSCYCGGSLRLVIGAGVQIAPSALENKGGEVRQIDATEKQWDKDMPAYKRMRDRGMQPRAIDGSARLEDRVEDQLDVNYDALKSEGVTRERVIEGTQQAAEIMADGVPL